MYVDCAHEDFFNIDGCLGVFQSMSFIQSVMLASEIIIDDDVQVDLCFSFDDIAASDRSYSMDRVSPISVTENDYASISEHQGKIIDTNHEFTGVGRLLC